MTSRAFTLLLALAVAALTLPLQAQVPPTATEAAAYQGLHAAAYRGDLATIQKLAVSKTALEVRDGAGRVEELRLSLPDACNVKFARL